MDLMLIDLLESSKAIGLCPMGSQWLIIHHDAWQSVSPPNCKNIKICVQGFGVKVNYEPAPPTSDSHCTIKNQFSYFSTKASVVGAQKNRLNETVLLSTQNIWLKWWIRKYVIIISR